LDQFSASGRVCDDAFGIPMPDIVFGFLGRIVYSPTAQDAYCRRYEVKSRIDVRQWPAPVNRHSVY
jgi:hypothetical protein